MRELTDNPVKSNDSPKAVSTTGCRTLETATSVGGIGATVCFSIFYPNPLKYTDPDGRSDDEQIDNEMSNIIPLETQLPIPSKEDLTKYLSENIASDNTIALDSFQEDKKSPEKIELKLAHPTFTINEDDMSFSIQANDAGLSNNTGFVNIDADFDIQIDKNFSFHLDLRKFRPTLGINLRPFSIGQLGVDIIKKENIKERSRIDIYFTLSTK
jgi:hypothetical protein